VKFRADHRLKLAVAAVLVFRASTSLQAARGLSRAFIITFHSVVPRHGEPFGPPIPMHVLLFQRSVSHSAMEWKVMMNLIPWRMVIITSHSPGG
jgi:hypothetical protein